ncbi:MAG: hypothetical protein ACRENE_08905 [Polyangiaceae bacterium]
MRLAMFAVCLACVTPACSSSSSSSPSDSGAGTGDDAAPEGGGPAGGDAGDDGSAICTTLANPAPLVTIVQVASAPPAFQGGTVVDGTYALTSEAIYTGAGGATGPMGTASITIQFKSGTIQVAKDTSPPTSTYAFAPTGTTYLATARCPAGLGNIAGSYTATATTFVASLGAPGNDGGPPLDVDTFTKQ